MNRSVLWLCLVLAWQAPGWGAAASSADVSKEKESFIKNTEERLQQWNAKVEALRKRAEKAGSRTRVEIDRDLKALQEETGALQKSLSELKGSKEGTWTRLRHGIEQAFHEIKESYKRAKSAFK
jgi:peptidoglycan hydrolase CwlO-like protein